MERIGKLIKFESLNKNFTNSMGKILYKFSVEFDNEDRGEANSSTPDASAWKLNKEYSYELTKNGAYTNITKMKQTDSYKGGSGSKGSYYDDPKVQQRITRAFAVESAAAYLVLPHIDKTKVTKEHLLKVALNIEEYVYSGLDRNASNSEILLDRRKSIEVALKITTVPCFAVTDFKGFVIIANDCLACIEHDRR